MGKFPVEVETNRDNDQSGCTELLAYVGIKMH